jgi:leucyl-tRNA synthetase
LYDLKLVPTVEPYKKRTSHGMILGEGGVKMSKSLGNVVNPDEIVKVYGADTLRVYEMFIGPFEDTAVWNTESIIGSRRFIEKAWRISNSLTSLNFSALRPSQSTEWDPRAQKIQRSSAIKKLLHKTIKKVSEDIETMHFNTAISAMMILASEMEKADFVEKEDYKKFLQILAPFAPHTTEELWKSFGEKKSIHISKWPSWDENLIKDDEVKIAVQINGKVRTEIMIEVTMTEDEVKKRALESMGIAKFISGVEIKRVIYVKNRLINIVI